MTIFKITPIHLVRALALIAVSLSSGCATPADQIQPQPVSNLQYSGYSCPDLAKEQVSIDSTLVKLSAEQWQTRVDDVYGYIFLLMPLGRLAGRDYESQIALYKGEREAVLRMTAVRGCSRVL
jgi:hypothetical protein